MQSVQAREVVICIWAVVVRVFPGIKQPLERHEWLFVQVWEPVLSQGTRRVTKQHGCNNGKGTVVGTWAPQSGTSGTSDWDCRKS